MKRFTSIFKSDDFLSFLVVIFFAVLASRTLIFQSGYFNMHDDLQMMRQLQMEKCFLDGQIPCRWVPDMGYGHGFPLFNFYPPLPYLVGEIFRIFQFSFVASVKLTFALSIIGSGSAMYFLARKFFTQKVKANGKSLYPGAILAAVFYVWAPYHAVDVFVRGAMNESWALVFFPLIFLSSYNLITEKEKSLSGKIILLTLSYFGLLISHNLMVLIFTPVFLVWCVIWIIKNKDFKKVIPLAISGIWAFGLSAFFTLPAIFENKFTQIHTQLQGYFDYTAHFVNLNQLLFSRFWGYGGSVWLDNDTMSFQIGHLHWILSLLVGLLILVLIFANFKNARKLITSPLLLTTVFMILVGWAAAFMTHSRSIAIYQIFDQLRLVQFPWRFLTLVIFPFSFVVGSLPEMIEKTFQGNKGNTGDMVKRRTVIMVTVFLTFSLVFANWSYFLPEKGRMTPLSDEEKFSGVAWELQQNAGILDYLPETAKFPPKEPKTVGAEAREGNVEIINYQEGSYWALFNADVKTPVAKVRLNIMEFPGWKIFIDGVETEVYIPESELWGRMWFDLSEGQHRVYAQFMNTPVRTYSNIASLASWILLFSFPLWRKKQISLKS